MILSSVQTEVSEGLNDPTNSIYSVAIVNTAINRAVRACSEYHPCYRQIGVGNLLQDIAVGATTIQTVGGPFNVGEVLYLDAGGPNIEGVVISSITIAQDDTQPCGYLIIRLTEPTIYSHIAGAYLYPEAFPFGVTITYPIPFVLLPLDFLAPDQNTFDLAVGRKLTYRKQNGFYDATWSISQDLSGTFFGSSTDWGPNNNVSYPLVGNIWNNPNSGAPNVGFGFWYKFFYAQNPRLQVVPNPANGYNQTFYFDYWGCHTVQSYPSSDQETVVLYAIWAAIMGQAASVNTINGGNVKIEEFEQQPAANSGAYLKIAQEAYKRWEDKTRFTPFGCAG